MNPTLSQLNESDMDLIVAGTKRAVLMIEAGTQFVSETDLLAAIDAAHEMIKLQCEMQEELAAKVGVVKVQPKLYLPNADILQAIHDRMDADIRATIQNPDKAARESAIGDLKKEIVEKLLPDFPDNKSDIYEAADKAVKGQIRALIIEDGIRPDGRKVDEIRPITCEVGLYCPAFMARACSRAARRRC